MDVAPYTPFGAGCHFHTYGDAVTTGAGATRSSEQARQARECSGEQAGQDADAAAGRPGTAGGPAQVDGLQAGRPGGQDIPHRSGHGDSDDYAAHWSTRPRFTTPLHDPASKIHGRRPRAQRGWPPADREASLLGCRNGRDQGGHGGMDRPDADRLRLVPGRGQHAGETATVLRPPVPAGGSRRHLLRAAHPTPVRALPADLREAASQAGKDRVYLKDVDPAVTDQAWDRFLAALEPLRGAAGLRRPGLAATASGSSLYKNMI